MKLEETIQELFDECPEIFQERWQCLDHLFCVIGNGYEWVDGELIKPYMDDPKTGDYIKREGEYLNFKGTLGEDGKAIQRKIFKNKIIENWEWYGLEDSSYLINYPENIKSDWLEGIEETKQLLIKDGETITVE